MGLDMLLNVFICIILIKTIAYFTFPLKITKHLRGLSSLNLRTYLKPCIYIVCIERQSFVLPIS